MNTQLPTRILICAGHTGGHFFPAVSCAETFKSAHPEVEIHILLNRLPSFAERLAAERSFHFHVIPFSSFQALFSFKAPLFLLEYGLAFWKTIFLFLKIKPRLVIGFGSYGSVPGVLCAALFGIPILLHEQNALAGRANQFLALWAKRVAVSFPQTEGKLSRQKVFWSGYPLRRLFRDGSHPSSQERHSEKRFTVLVLGGSQGAKRLNQIFLESLEMFTTVERSCFAVIHIVGNDDLEEIELAYQKLGIAADVCRFSHRIAEYYQGADIVVSRAGAGTIFELAALGRAAILIPYPHAYAHQKVNAEYLAQRGAACVVRDEDLSAITLREALVRLRDDAPRRAQLEKNIKRLAKPEANQLLAEAGWRLVCGKNSSV